MSLRIGFDIDGVLADCAAEVRAIETRLFGPGARGSADTQDQDRETESSDDASAGEHSAAAADQRDNGPNLEAARRRSTVSRVIASTPDFWTTLGPIDEGAVARIHTMMLEHRWEVFFITQRPSTVGDTVQRQTQRWLVAQGFDLPSVIVLGGSRGAAAGALRLNYHVDDSPQHCIDVMSASRAKPILVVPDSNESVIATARRLGVGTARSIGACLDILEAATTACQEPGLLTRIAAAVGWKREAAVAPDRHAHRSSSR